MENKEIVINTTPHPIFTANADNTEFVKYPAAPQYSVRLKTVTGEPIGMMGGVPVRPAPKYVLDPAGVSQELRNLPDLNKSTLIVSTLVANCAYELRNELNAPDLKITVPDSGPTRLEGSAAYECMGGPGLNSIAVRGWFNY